VTSALLEIYVKYIALILRLIDVLLEQEGVKVEANVMHRVPDDCENCLEHVIVIRTTCPENPEICKKLIEAFREEIQEAQ